MPSLFKFKLPYISVGLDIGGTLTKVAIATPKHLQHQLSLNKQHYEG